MIIVVLEITEGANGRVNGDIQVQRDNATPKEEKLVDNIAAACQKIARKGKGCYAEERRTLMIQFFVPGEPKGQPRARAFAMKRGGQTFVRMYTPGSAEAWKGQIAHAAEGHLGEPLAGPLSVALDLYFPRPKSHFRSNGQLKDGAPVAHTCKPDVDNAAKAILDALTTLRAWMDDKQVCGLHVAKLYGEKPGAMVTIKRLCNG